MLETTKKTHSNNSEFFGHPAGLSTLFFTEMWERMSYYGMRALLVLFMTLNMQEGGLGLTVASATAIYGLYTGAVYFFGLPGGWIADRLIGGQKAIWYGGIIIMLGHILLTIPNNLTFFIGLIFIILGTGLLKPNIGALVGSLYSKEDSRRDAGYALYYMGINIGSIIGYIICGWLQIYKGYHWAFGAAAIGMGIGLIQFKLTLYKLEGMATRPTQPLTRAGQRNSKLGIIVFLFFLVLLIAVIFSGEIAVNPISIAQYVAALIAIIFLGYYAAFLFFIDLDLNERKSLIALFLICLASTLFWAGAEQAGSSLNLFGRDFTNRLIGAFEIPTSWFQSANSFFIVILSPFFAALWVNLGKNLIRPNYGLKCATGLIIMSSGFIVMFFASQAAASGFSVAPYWLITTYFLHTVGELCLSPVALSAVSRLSPKRLAGQMMGVFTLTYSIGSLVAGLIAGKFDPGSIYQMPNLYLQITFFLICSGIVIAIFATRTRNWESLLEEPTASLETKR